MYNMGNDMSTMTRAVTRMSDDVHAMSTDMAIMKRHYPPAVCQSSPTARNTRLRLLASGVYGRLLYR
jgi:hypothetical protein